MTPQPYTYKALVTSVHDGDTFTCDIDLGMGVWVRNQKVRLNRVNAPELATETGPQWRKWLNLQLLPMGYEPKFFITIQTIKDKKEKYGRWLGEVWVGGTNVNDELIRKLGEVKSE